MVDEWMDVQEKKLLPSKVSPSLAYFSQMNMFTMAHGFQKQRAPW